MTVAETGNVRGRDAKTRQRNLTRLEARANSERARKEFAGTLNALEDKLNVPKQVRIKGERARATLRRFAKEQPGTAIAAGVAVAAAVGVTVWLIVRAVVDND